MTPYNQKAWAAAMLDHREVSSFIHLGDKLEASPNWRAWPLNLPNSGAQPVSYVIVKPNLWSHPNSGHRLWPHLIAEYSMRPCLTEVLLVVLPEHSNTIQLKSMPEAHLTRSNYRVQPAAHPNCRVQPVVLPYQETQLAILPNWR